MLILLINSIVVSLSVIIHYEILRLLFKKLPTLAVRPRLKIVLGVLGNMTAHTIEVWVFAVFYYWLLQYDGIGELRGNFDGSLLDCAYYSLTNFTSLGTGDIEPFGSIRFLAGMEALCGLVLITWSASFMFLEMQKYWLYDYDTTE